MTGNSRKLLFLLAVGVTGLAALAPVAPARADALSDFGTNIASMSDLAFGQLHHITVGLGPRFSPDYPGSNDYKIKPHINLDVRFSNRLSANTQGLEYALFGIERVSFGPLLHISGRRGPHANPDLEGLGRIKRSPELGVFAKAIWPGQLSLRLSASQGIARGHEGTLVTLEGSAQVFRSAGESVTGYLGASTTWSSAPYARTFFGIDAEQSANSGIPMYDPGNSMRDASVSATLRWVLNSNWTVNSTAEYSRLLADVAGSPIVKDYGSADQVSVGIILTRTFRLK
jgi:outer membrane scaffolding protein for murein synthesis (MipA/OmpV family)